MLEVFRLPATRRPPIRRFARNAAIIIGMTLLLFVLVEGVSSVVLFGWRLATSVERRSGMDWRHTRFDAELGWAHEPNSAVANLYAPGIDITINSQGFRASVDYAVAEPPGMLRVICSGDSFTLGYGVGDPDPWCAQLSSIDPRIETVNMGQVAYGVGQAYLWYMRDGRPFDHSVHILGVISVDFERMVADDFLGVAKPRLAIEDGALVVRNVPVRAPGRRLSRLELVEQIEDLRVVQAARAALRRLPTPSGPASGAATKADSLPDPTSMAVMSGILDSLIAANTAKGSTFAIAFIPTRSDLSGDGMTDRSAAWLRFLEAEARARDFLLIDLIGAFAGRSPAEVDAMYIPRSAGVGRAHLSIYGNRLAAEEIYRRMIAVPAVAARLDFIPKPEVSGGS